MLLGEWKHVSSSDEIEKERKLILPAREGQNEEKDNKGVHGRENRWGVRV